MHIESIPVETPPVLPGASPSQVVLLQVSGVMDSGNDVVRRARELIGRTGSQAMADSFDWAVENDILGTGA